MIIKKINYSWSKPSTTVPPIRWTSTTTNRNIKGWDKNQIAKEGKTNPAKG